MLFLSSRLFDQFRKLVGELLRPTVFLGSYAYRVVDLDEGIADLQFIAVTRGPTLPDLSVPLWSGVPGVEGDPQLGSSVLVRFVNGDPARPYVEAYEGLSTPGFLPTRVNLDASSSVTVGGSASSVALGARMAASPINAVTHGVPVCYGDNISVAIVGGVATGPINLALAAVDMSTARTK